MTSHYTRGSVTTLHDVGGVLGRPWDTFFWALTINFMVTAFGSCVKWPSGGRLFTILNSVAGLVALHTMAEGREAIDFHQSNCKKPRIWPLDPSHYRRRNLKRLLFEEGDGLSKEVWV